MSVAEEGPASSGWEEKEAEKELESICMKLGMVGRERERWMGNGGRDMKGARLYLGKFLPRTRPKGSQIFERSKEAGLVGQRRRLAG